MTRADIRHHPYAHAVVENCLPADLYAELSRTFPADETILRIGGSPGRKLPRPNSRHDVGARRILANPDCFSTCWQDFVRYHVSNAFFREFIAFMGQEILATHPQLEQRLGRSLSELRTGVLDSPESDNCEVALDCHVGINTPARHRGSVRRVHTDAPDELFAALVYFRAENDQAEGGDLEILQWKHNRAQRFVGSEVAVDTELCYTVPTRPNTAVIFINSALALHAVTARGASQVSRRLVNIMGRVPRSIPEGLFLRRQKRDVLSLWNRARQRHRIASGRF